MESDWELPFSGMPRLGGSKSPLPQAMSPNIICLPDILAALKTSADAKEPIKHAQRGVATEKLLACYNGCKHKNPKDIR